jgi:hypothetical protein
MLFPLTVLENVLVRMVSNSHYILGTREVTVRCVGDDAIELNSYEKWK